MNKCGRCKKEIRGISYSWNDDPEKYCYGCYYSEGILWTRKGGLCDSEKIERVKAIIEKHEISCGEDIWQRDSILENALTIIEEICIIVGYYVE